MAGGLQAAMHALCGAILAGAALIAPAFPVRAAEQTAPVQNATAIRVNTFPNAKALPIYVGIAKGVFAHRGLNVELETTDSSQSQRDGLAAGRFQIAHSALDNAVAMIEVAKRDVVIVAGGDSGMNEFFVQPGIGSFADLGAGRSSSMRPIPPMRYRRRSCCCCMASRRPSTTR